MSNINSEITIKKEIRPCIVDGSTPALFHCWSEESYIHIAVLKGDVSGVIKDTVGILEFEDGHIEKRKPESIQFTDRIFSQYIW